MANQQVTEIEIRKIKLLTQAGESKYEIARLLKRSSQTIWRYQKENK